MSIHLLLVEDNPGDALLLQHTLDSQYPGQYTFATSETLGEAKAIIAREAFDAVLLDLSRGHAARLPPQRLSRQGVENRACGVQGNVVVFSRKEISLSKADQQSNG